jgi:NhaP-type Na+/H+ or K+/H+ antiporter
VSWSVVGLAAVLVGWSLLARRLQRWRITPVMALVLTGALVGFATHDALAMGIEAHVIEPIIEMILAIVLFEHATNIRGGFLGGQANLVLRLLFVAMPIGLALTVALGLWLLPGLSWPTLLVIACVVVPIDFAPVASFLHDERIPVRVRRLFNVEEGYSDGVIAPVFLFALAVASGEHTKTEGIGHALWEGVPRLVVAIVLGVVIGAGVAWCANAADRHGTMTDQSRRLLVVGAPVLTYTLNVGLHGNGFVAAFVCGIAYNGVRQYVDAGRELELVDDIAFLLAGIVWFVFGAVAWYLIEDGVPMEAVVFSVLVLTVVRAVPVGLTMLRTPLTGPERLLVAGLGPRGTASIALALLAYNVLPDEPADTLLTIVVLVVLGSVVIHGVAGPLLVGRSAVDGKVPARQ